MYILVTTSEQLEKLMFYKITRQHTIAVRPILCGTINISESTSHQSKNLQERNMIDVNIRKRDWIGNCKKKKVSVIKLRPLR